MSSAVRVFRALIMGAPGSGKGTISERIVREFGLQHVSSGDLLRAEVAAATELGRQVHAHMDAGELVPDATMLQLVTGQLQLLGSTSWLLDGFPRTRQQAEQLQQLQPLDAVISLNVPFEEIVERVKDRWVHPGSGRVYNTRFRPPRRPFLDDVTGERLVQRADDAPHAVRRRLQLYRTSVEPLLAFYSQLALLQQFSGRQTDAIWPHVHQYLQTTFV